MILDSCPNTPPGTRLGSACPGPHACSSGNLRYVATVRELAFRRRNILNVDIDHYSHPAFRRWRRILRLRAVGHWRWRWYRIGNNLDHSLNCIPARWVPLARTRQTRRLGGPTTLSLARYRYAFVTGQLLKFVSPFVPRAASSLNQRTDKKNGPFSHIA